MLEYRNKEQIRAYYERELIERKIMVELWEGVKRVYKKDGKPFAILSKNYVGGKIQKSPFGWRELYVGCYSEELRTSVYDVIIDVDNMTLEQIDEEVEKRIKLRKENVVLLEKMLQDLDEVVAKCDAYIKEGEILMKSVGVNPFSRTLVREYVKANQKV